MDRIMISFTCTYICLSLICCGAECHLQVLTMGILVTRLSLFGVSNCSGSFIYCWQIPLEQCRLCSCTYVESNDECLYCWCQTTLHPKLDVWFEIGLCGFIFSPLFSYSKYTVQLWSVWSWSTVILRCNGWS